MRVIRWIITTLVAHLICSFAVAMVAMDSEFAIPAGLMFAIFGAFYLIVEAPLVFLGQLILDQFSSRKSLVVTGIGFSVLGAVLGYLLCFKEGGSRPDDYARGFAVAGGLAGLLTLLSVMKWPLRNQQAKPRNPDLALPLGMG
jgi:hypothetical protein